MSNIETPPSNEEVITQMVENATAAGRNFFQAFQDFLGFPNSSSDPNIENSLDNKQNDKGKMLEKQKDSENTGDAKNNREWPNWDINE